MIGSMKSKQRSDRLSASKTCPWEFHLSLSRFASPCRPSAPLRSVRRQGLLRLLPGFFLLALNLPPAAVSAQQLANPALESAPFAAPRAFTAAALGLAPHRRLLTQRFLNGRHMPAGSPGTPAQAMAHARAQQADLLAQPRLASLTAAWQPLGPTSIVSSTYGNLTGRISALALDPNDPTGNTLYVGTTGGGVWKSTDAAGTLASASFSPLTDTLPVFAPNAGSAAVPSLSIGAVAVQPAPNPVVLAGTGDPNDATDSLYGEGLLRSVDGGLTWTLVGGSHDGADGNHSFLGLATAAIAFSSTMPSLVVAAFSTSPQSAVVDAANTSSIPGLYYSTDAGQTWQMSTVYDAAQLVQEPQGLGTGGLGNAATSVVWDARRLRFYAALRSHGYYSSPDGVTWTRLAIQPGTGLTSTHCPVGINGQGSANCPIFRGTLAVQPVTGDLYALTVDANDADGGLWQDLCNVTPSGVCASAAPAFSTRLDNGALDAGSPNGTIAQGGYNLSLAAAPAANNGTTLFVGTIDLYRCSLAANASSCTLRNTTNALDGCHAPAAVAPAQHALASLSQTSGNQTSGNPLLFLGNDGGLWRSLDGVAETGSVCSATDAAHFDNLNAALGSGGSLAEVVGFAGDPTSADTLLAGLGANGSAATTAASSLAAWPQLSAGEGGYPQLDPADPLNWWLAIGAGVNLKACTLGSACTASSFVPPATVGEPQVADDASLLDAPTLLDPAATADLLVGTCRVWRGPAGDGSGWSTANVLSSAFDGSATPCNANSPLIQSLAAGGPVSASVNAQLSGSAVLYAGLSGLLAGGGSLPGHLFLTKSANTASSTIPWTDIALGKVTNDFANVGVFNPAAFSISSVSVDAHDTTGATVYATIQGFGAVPHVYRSVDFGAHWLNISANLPSAPANAVLVDPNDANTVYVALDTGVYATAAVATCPTTNCWSILGAGLPNAPAVALSAAPNLPTGDGRRGLLRVGTYGRGIWQQPLLNAVSILQPALSASPTSLNFSAQQVATQSATQTVVLTSNGNSPATISSLALTGDFTETDTCAGKTLNVGGACTVSVRFAPILTGSRSGQLTVYADIVGGGQLTIDLAGTATAAADVVLTPLSLTFPATTVNNTAAAQIITVANTGGNPATLGTPALSGDFALKANTCGATLAPQTACSLSVTFTPTASGARNGTLTVTGSAGVQTAALTGIGNAPATDTLSAASLTFAQQQIGTSSAPQQLTLTNTGDNPLTLITASIGPTVSGGSDFTVTNSCGNSLAAHSACALVVGFVPSATGTRTATLSITDQFRTQTVLLNGGGVAPPGVSLTPAILTFPATGVGLAAPAQTLTLSNSGGLPLTVANLAVGAGFVLASDTCPATLAVNAACTLTVIFSPVGPGPVSAALNLTDNAPSAQQTVNLSGTGIDFTLVPDSPAAVTVASGASATYALLLSSLPSLSGNLAFSCAGAPANSTCTVSPTTPTLGSATVMTVTVQTGLAAPALAAAPASSSFNPGNRSPFLGLLLLPLATIPFSSRSRRGSRLLLCFLLMGLASAGLTGCGAARIIPNAVSPSGNPTGVPTPSGAYPITVTATAAGLSHAVHLTLTVQ